MQVDLFDFELPERLIALRPANPRDAARMLVVRPGAEPELEDRHVRDLPDLLDRGDVLVLNDTRVIPAALEGRRSPRQRHALDRSRQMVGPRIHIQLHKRAGPNVWRAFARPARKLETGDFVSFGGALSARVEARGEAGEVVLVFDREADALDAAIAEVGITPLPPYIARRRPPDERDGDDYQTVYARADGSVAAPTAGLHFTDALFERLADRGVGCAFVTLHVGAGTFLPVKSEDTAGHRMHAEWGLVDRRTADTLNAARDRGGRIVAVGTTAMRLLESAVDSDGMIRPFAAETDIFITPGFRFRAVDALMTNFHLPRSTLFMLVAAFSGLDTMKRAYAHAVAHAYRFYSYGDASLLFPADGR